MCFFFNYTLFMIREWMSQLNKKKMKINLTLYENRRKEQELAVLCRSRRYGRCVRCAGEE